MKRTLLTSKNFTVVSDEFLSASAGVKKTVEYIEQPMVVIAVPVLPDGRVVLVEHHRPILGATLLECPGGKVDSGESPEVAMQRELEEEAGFSAARLRRVTYVFSSVGTSTEQIHCYIASDLRRHSRRDEDVKRMSVVTLSLDEIKRRMANDEIRDGKTVIALTKYAIELGALVWR